ncbi:hypothetical protein KJ781_01615 [Patescibacteria group bacterium]|nr:hypothetical protein [Patescibacteria group bacterium]MBU1448527.1 hypothetical protein [Patescibacteria group bacterium]MBU2613354.1 hypothetical protein [Patescibacteria group bacterium]
MFGLTDRELSILKPLDTPRKIQDYLEKIPENSCNDRDTCLSPRMMLREKRAHCVEGAMFAALALRFHGDRPLVVDLTASRRDLDHVIAVFRRGGYWGAISKTNYPVLRYREPVYRTIRELVMSYFHEYIIGDGSKTLRSFSRPVNLSRFDDIGWMTAEEDVWAVPEHLADIPHVPILTRSQIAALRLADPIERDVLQIEEWDT